MLINSLSWAVKLHLRSEQGGRMRRAYLAQAVVCKKELYTKIMNKIIYYTMNLVFIFFQFAT